MAGATGNNRWDRGLAALTRRSSRSPWPFLGAAMLLFAASVFCASHLKVQSSFVKLLPDRNPIARRFQLTLDRKGGSGADLLVVIESPDAAANQRFVDALAVKLRGLPPGMVTTIEKGPQETKDFIEKWKWLFAGVADLRRIKCELSTEREKYDPSWLALDDDCDGLEAKPAGTAGATGAKQNPLARFESEMAARIQTVDRFPTGYYRNDRGDQFVMRVIAPGTGFGELSGTRLLQRVTALAEELRPSSFHPQMTVGFGGSIANAAAELKALVNDIWLVSVLAVGLILLSIVIYFRSPWALLHLGLCVGTGTSIALATAMLAFGHLNQATSFLVSLVSGNGVNHGIMYLARYRERRAQGAALEEALVGAAVSVRRGTLLGALASGGAFGCLLITSFRGFSEFGLIGAVGMLACWSATFLFLPASVSALERLRRPWYGRAAAEYPAGRGRSALPGRMARLTGGLADRVSRVSQRRAAVILVVAGLLVAIAIVPLPRYLADPWEYDFARLGSVKSKNSGAGQASTKADKIFGTRGAPILLLADGLEQALPLADQLLQQDRRRTGGRTIERVETIYDRLGGSPAEVQQKLQLLAEIRDHVDAALPHLQGHDRQLAGEWRPPEWLRPLRPADLPPQLREQFSELDGRLGTPVYAYLNRRMSQSQGRNILAISDLLETVTLPSGQVAPNASRASVLAAIIRSLERDAPRATLAAFLLVVAITLFVTRRVAPAMAVLGSLLFAVLYTVGSAAWLGVRLNFLNFVAIPLTFGIGVEYAINLYERIRVLDGDIVRGIRSAGGAVFLCSLTTIIGYGALLVADNVALQTFGRYAIGGEFACILTALFVMPAALHFRRRRRAPGRQAL